MTLSKGQKEDKNMKHKYKLAMSLAEHPRWEQMRRPCSHLFPKLCQRAKWFSWRFSGNSHSCQARLGVRHSNIFSNIYFREFPTDLFLRKNTCSKKKQKALSPVIKFFLFSTFIFSILLLFLQVFYVWVFQVLPVIFLHSVIEWVCLYFSITLYSKLCSLSG